MNTNLPMPKESERITGETAMIALIAVHTEAARACVQPSLKPGSAEPTSEHPAHRRIRRANALVAVTR